MKRETRALRRGYTTGSCAAAAARAACRCLFRETKNLREIEILLPENKTLTIPVHSACKLNSLAAEASVVKDAGDDPDETNGALICVRLKRGKRGEAAARDGTVTLSDRLYLCGGEGVGRVTLPGLKIPPGEPAVNPVPRRMIRENLEAEMASLSLRLKAEDILLLEISVPGGEELAEKTFNPRLGILGGISIIGTSGIVEPMSEEALKDSLLTELDVAKEINAERVGLTFGAMGEKSLKLAMEAGRLPQCPVVICSNFVGFLLQACVERGYREILLGGALGKMIKLAGGIFQTHSHTADARAEIMTAYAALEGFPPQRLREIFEAVTTDACLPLLEETGLRDKVLQRIMARIQEKVSREFDSAFQLRILLTDGRGDFLSCWGEKDNKVTNGSGKRGACCDEN